MRKGERGGGSLPLYKTWYVVFWNIIVLTASQTYTSSKMFKLLCLLAFLAFAAAAPAPGPAPAPGAIIGAPYVTSYSAPFVSAPLAYSAYSLPTYSAYSAYPALPYAYKSYAAYVA